MKRYHRILAAIDFSRYANLVMEHAVALAKDLNAEIVLVNIINQRDIDVIADITKREPDTRAKLSAEDYIEGVQMVRKNKMKDLLKEFETEGVNTRFVIKKGVPFQALLEAITEEKADLMVMGVKGKTDLVDVIVGSTALKMFRRCPVPLVSIREDSH
jgi:nucleotide-binding universal stress UspA family protein